MTDHDPMNETTTTQTEAPYVPPQPPPLVRPREGRVIAGVAAGLAARLGIGTGWVRAGFVIATFFGGSGVLLYILAWLAIPEEGARAGWAFPLRASRTRSSSATAAMGSCGAPGSSFPSRTARSTPTAAWALPTSPTPR